MSTQQRRVFLTYSNKLKKHVACVRTDNGNDMFTLRARVDGTYVVVKYVPLPDGTYDVVLVGSALEVVDNKKDQLRSTPETFESTIRNEYERIQRRAQKKRARERKREARASLLARKVPKEQPDVPTMSLANTPISVPKQEHSSLASFIFDKPRFPLQKTTITRQALMRMSYKGFVSYINQHLSREERQMIVVDGKLHPTAKNFTIKSFVSEPESIFVYSKAHQETPNCALAPNASFAAAQSLFDSEEALKIKYEVILRKILTLFLKHVDEATYELYLLTTTGQYSYTVGQETISFRYYFLPLQYLFNLIRAARSKQ